MILDENLFEAETRGVKVGTKRMPYKTDKRERKSKFTQDSVYGDLEKLGYNPYGDGKGFQIGKFKESSLNKAKEYLDSKNIPYTIKYQGYPKKYWMHIDVSGLSESIKENTYATKSVTGDEMSFDVQDDGTLTIYKGNEEIKRTRTDPKYARKVFSDLGFKEMVKEGWKDIAKSDKQSFESIISKEEFDKLISSDKTNHLTINNYNITWYPEHGLIIRKIVDGRARPFADMIDKELVLKGYETVKKEYDSQINYPNSHLNTPEEIDESAEYDETQPPKGIKYYIKVNTGAKNGGIGASYVYGKIKEFPDGTKIGIHKTPYDEKVATDIRTGMRIIGTHSPIYKGGELLEPKKKESELFDQAYELLKSIDKDYYNSIPDIKTLVGEEEVNESKNSSLKGKFESQKGFFKESHDVRTKEFLNDEKTVYVEYDLGDKKYYIASDYDRYQYPFDDVESASYYYKKNSDDINKEILNESLKEDLPQDFENLPREERIELLKIENERKALLKAINNIGQLANKNPTVKQDWKVIKDLLRQNNILKEDLSQEEQQEYGLNTLINTLIKSEYDAIDEYNSAIVTLEAENQGEYTDVIRSIIEDERHHIGNLQEIMNRITPGTTAEFEHGKEEAIETLDEEKPEEIKTTIDTENGEIKTYKLDKVEKVEEDLNSSITVEQVKATYDKYIDCMNILQRN